MLIGLNSITFVSQGQSSTVPAGIIDTFTKMYPNASNVEWRDKITNFVAFFNSKDAKCEAKFTKEGAWINTEESIRLDSLPAQVRQGLQHSKYAGWKENSSYILKLPGEKTQYHIVVTNNDMGRKILFFTQSGELLADR